MKFSKTKQNKTQNHQCQKADEGLPGVWGRKGRDKKGHEK
jgi:hypothetical protein